MRYCLCGHSEEHHDPDGVCWGPPIKNFCYPACTKFCAATDDDQIAWFFEIFMRTTKILAGERDEYKTATIKLREVMQEPGTWYDPKMDKLMRVLAETDWVKPS